MKPYGNFRKLYESIRRHDAQSVAVSRMEDLAEIDEIWRFYEKLSPQELQLVGAAIKKTEAQLGYIPFCFSTVPFVFLIFSAKLSNMLVFNMIVLCATLLSLTVLAVWLIHRHFKLKSYNALHRHIVETLLDQKRSARAPEPSAPSPSPPFTCSQSAPSP